MNTSKTKEKLSVENILDTSKNFSKINNELNRTTTILENNANKTVIQIDIDEDDISDPKKDNGNQVFLYSKVKSKGNYFWHERFITLTAKKISSFKSQKDYLTQKEKPNKFFMLEDYLFELDKANKAKLNVENPENKGIVKQFEFPYIDIAINWYDKIQSLKLEKDIKEYLINREKEPMKIELNKSLNIVNEINEESDESFNKNDTIVENNIYNYKTKDNEILRISKIDEDAKNNFNKTCIFENKYNLDDDKVKINKDFIRTTKTCRYKNYNDFISKKNTKEITMLNIKDIYDKEDLEKSKKEEKSFKEDDKTKEIENELTTQKLLNNTTMVHEIENEHSVFKDTNNKENNHYRFNGDLEICQNSLNEIEYTSRENKQKSMKDDINKDLNKTQTEEIFIKRNSTETYFKKLLNNYTKNNKIENEKSFEILKIEKTDDNPLNNFKGLRESIYKYDFDKTNIPENLKELYFKKVELMNEDEAGNLFKIIEKDLIGNSNNNNSNSRNLPKKYIKKPWSYFYPLYKMGYDIDPLTNDSVYNGEYLTQFITDKNKENKEHKNNYCSINQESLNFLQDKKTLDRKETEVENNKIKSKENINYNNFCYLKTRSKTPIKIKKIIKTKEFESDKETKSSKRTSEKFGESSAIETEPLYLKPQKYQCGEKSKTLKKTKDYYNNVNNNNNPYYAKSLEFHKRCKSNDNTSSKNKKVYPCTITPVKNVNIYDVIYYNEYEVKISDKESSDSNNYINTSLYKKKRINSDCCFSYKKTEETNNNKQETQKKTMTQILQSILNNRYKKDMLLYCIEQNMKTSTFYERFREHLDMIKYNPKFKGLDGCKVLSEILINLPKLIEKRLNEDDLSDLLDKNSYRKYNKNFMKFINIKSENEDDYKLFQIKALISNDISSIMNYINDYFSSLETSLKTSLFQKKINFNKKMESLQSHLN